MRASLAVQWLRICCQCKGHGFEPWSRRSHMPRSNQARVPQLLKPACLEPMLHNKRSHCNEKPMRYNEW